MGWRVSEKQWRDILGVIKTQAERLGVAYMCSTAPALGAPGGHGFLEVQ